MSSSLPYDLQGELDFSRRRHGRAKQSGDTRRRTRRIKDVGIIGKRRRSEVGMIEEIEDFCPELHIEVFRNSSNIVVLKHRKIEFFESRSAQDISASVPPEVETLREYALGRVAICGIECSGWSRRNRKALSLDVVVRISRIYERFTSGSVRSIRDIPCIAAILTKGVSICAESWSERNPTLRFEDTANLPSAGNPRCKPGKGTRSRNVPNPVDHQGAAYIKV